jgi:hypothetical protein
MLPFTWPLESTMTLAFGPSFICQFASVAAEAGAANATTATNAAVSDDPNLFLMSFPLLLAVPSSHCPHAVDANPPMARPARAA